jgi:hypothetical protein
MQQAMPMARPVMLIAVNPLCFLKDRKAVVK